LALEGRKLLVLLRRIRKTFKHEFYALEFLHYLNKLGDKFDPSEWRKDTPYNFKKAIEVYLELGPGGPEWKHQKENISKRYLIPFFETGGYKGDQENSY